MSNPIPEAPGLLVTYLPDEQILTTHFTRAPSRPELAQLLLEAGELVRIHQCPRWLLNLLALPRPLTQNLRRQLLTGLVEIGTRSVGMRAGLVTTRPGEAGTWLDGLPLSFGAWAIDLASFTTSEQAQRWLRSSPRAHLYA